MANPRHGTHHGTILGYQIHLHGNDDVGPTPPCAWCISARERGRHPCPCGGWVHRKGTRCPQCRNPDRPAPAGRWLPIRRRGITRWIHVPACRSA